MIVDPELAEVAQFIIGSQDPDDRVFIDRLNSNPDALKLDFWKDHFEHLSIDRYPCINGNVLDFGCGSGHADVWLARRGHTIHGGDSSMAGINIARCITAKQIPDVSSRLKFDLMSTMLSDKSLAHTFDAVWASNVFEHIIDARSAIQAIAILTKPNAYMLIAVPQGNHYDDPDHVRHFETTFDLYWHFKGMLNILSIEHDKDNHMLRLLGTVPEQKVAPKGTIKERKHFLVNPLSMIQEGYTPPPLGLLHLAAMDPDTVIVDHAHNDSADIATVLKQHVPKIVGVPIYTLGRAESLRVLRLAKERGAITVAGGPHTSVLSERMAKEYPFIDHLVVGDGELAWQALTRGERLPKIIKMRVNGLNEMPIPAWNLVDVMSYQPWGSGTHRGNDLTSTPRCPIVLGRGCPGACAFCSSWSINGEYRSYSPEWMSRLLSRLWERGVRHLGWQDDCLTASREVTFDLCNVLSRYDFSSFGTTRVDCVDAELVRKMSEVGFYELSFGIESGSERILRSMGKKANLHNALVAREACRCHGVIFTALMMDGYPGDDDESRQETHDFLARLMPDKCCSLGKTIVLPGTRLHAAEEVAGRISEDVWFVD
jgi:radical SAM superfamily enzyme YgiQ (UPF0313 family)/2-polyprenyl-3-methyl-5-hydroxy-6-metoxy-1,4-benzoquinol methylase